MLFMIYTRFYDLLSNEFDAISDDNDSVKRIKHVMQINILDGLVN